MHHHVYSSRPGDCRRRGRVSVFVAVFFVILIVLISAASWWCFPTDGAIFGTDPSHAERIEFLDGGKIMLTASGGKVEDIRVWNFAERRCIRTIPDSALLAVSPDASRVATHSTLLHNEELKDEIQIWNSKTWEIEFRLRSPASLFLRIYRFSDDGNQLTGFGHTSYSHYDNQRQDQQIAWSKCIWSLADGPEPQTRELGESLNDVEDAVLSPDGTRLAVVFSERLRHRICLWDAETGHELWGLDEHSGYLQFMPDSRKLLCSLNATVTIFDVESGTVQDRFQMENCLKVSSYGLTASPSGQSIMAAGTKEILPRVLLPVLSVWNLPNSTHATRTFRGSMITCLKVTPDGGQLVVGTINGQIWVWRANRLTGGNHF